MASRIGTAVDSVSFAAFVDAISHRGAGQRSRLPAASAPSPRARLDEATTNVFLYGSGNLISSQEESVPRVGAEPRVRAYVKRLLR